jgi:NADH-quinone oxidoreductase subunit N
MPVHDDVFLTIAVLAAIAMVIGNVVALRQDNMKRLLAYSGVANAGYLLVPLAVPFTMVHASNFTEFTFYLMAYLFMTIGAIAVLIVLSQHSGNEKISSFAGLYYRAPFTAFAMVLFILSLAGLPPTGGFFGKIFILLGAVQAHQYWLAAIMIATSIISFYYYFTIIRQMFMRSNESSEVKLTGPLAVTIWLCAIATLLLGLVPHIVIEYIESVFSITFDLFFS